MHARQLTAAAGVAGVALAAGLVGEAAPQSAGSLQRELLLLIQGDDPVPAKGSPALCGDAESRFERGSPGWYFGEGDCSLAYPSSVSAMVTAASEGELAERLAAAETRARLVSLLQKLQLVVGGLSLQQRLMIHTTAWEIAYGLRRTEQGARRALPDFEPALCESLRLLKLTRFTPEQAAQLPSTLAELPKLAAAPEVAPTVGAILGKEKGIVEVVPGTDLHADLLLGRFMPRVFLTVADAEARQRLGAYLEDPARRYEDLKNLPRTFPGLQAILVLYFNVLGHDDRLLPTDQVAAWQQYSFSGTVGPEMSFAEAARRITFVNIEFERDLTDKDGLRYRKAEQGAMARQGLLDVKPWRPGLVLTTKRGQCLACHSQQVATFDTHGARRVDFAPPLERSSRDIESAYYRENIEAKLQRWARACEEAAAGGGSATVSDRPAPGAP